MNGFELRLCDVLVVWLWANPLTDLQTPYSGDNYIMEKLGY